jgi:hypothetical protein
LNPLKSFEAAELSAVEAGVVVTGAVVDVLVLEGTAEDEEGLSLRVETRADGPPHALRTSPAASATALASDNRDTEMPALRGSQVRRTATD